MILFYRITPFFVGLVLIGGFYAMLVSGANPLLSFGATLILSGLLFARLLQWKIGEFSFWHFFGTPLLFLIASIGAIFLLEQEIVIYAVAILAALLLVLFAEYVFQYAHLPSSYQPYSLEYLSLLLNILTIFYLSSLAFGALLLLQAPLPFLVVVFFFVFLFVTYGTLWVSKVHESRIKPYAVGGAILLTELFLVISFLPTGFFTNAAFLTTFFYLYLGLTRAHVLRNLSQIVIRRYLVVGGLLLLLTIASSQWI